MHIAHIITGLQMGGAEMMLLRLIRSLNELGLSSSVYSLREEGELSGPVAAAARTVQHLNLGDLKSLPRGVRQLRTALRAEPPAVVQGWMYHGNLLASLAGREVGHERVAWALHASALEGKKTPIGTQLLARYSGRIFGRKVKSIVCCSKVSLDLHRRWGYPKEKLALIPNGFDTDEFRPNVEARARARARLGFSDEHAVVGHVGRFHAQKDYPNLFRAAAILSKDMPRARFVFVGKGLEDGNEDVSRQLTESGVHIDRVHLLGLRRDTQELYQAFDALWLGSLFGEAFPLVLGEAMATGVPCVTTDVGDSASLVGSTGAVVAPARPDELAKAMRGLLELPAHSRMKTGEAARDRIQQHFSLPRIAHEYAKLYYDIAGR